MTPESLYRFTLTLSGVKVLNELWLLRPVLSEVTPISDYQMMSLAY